MYSKSGISYSAEVYMSTPYGEKKRWITPIKPSIKALEHYIRWVAIDPRFHDRDYKVDEIVVLKQRKRKMPKVHGYYDWVIDGKTFRGRMCLDKSKPAEIHNIFYGLE